ncbi:hypothetical protein V494_07848, partial [Pseudogymnoascus sp. VKM F-4513 (FW-928)]
STSPTQDDARLALETLISYMESAAPQGLVNEAEYQTVVKLTERMRQHRIGSLSGIAGGDNSESYQYPGPATGAAAAALPSTMHARSRRPDPHDNYTTLPQHPLGSNVVAAVF